MQKEVIRVDGLRVRYPGAARDAVAGIDLAVTAGEVFGLLGPNGAGKSTTQRVLTGQHHRFAGGVEVLGRPVAGWGRALYERIGVGFELPAYYPKLTARENLAAFAALYRGPVDRPEEALAAVGLAGAADQRAATFSKGMKMRLNLARAMLHRPDVLFLDEPTSGLDPVNAADVRAVIRAQADAGRTIFLTTHDMPAVEELCSRVAFMRDGAIVAVDTPRNLRLAYGHPSVAVEFDEAGTLRHAEFPAPDDPGLLALLATGRVQTVHTREAALADVFIAVTNHTPAGTTP
ncbi:ABC transporter ATP-binding protein [Dactylosporangium aurantiacum]|uniref:ABC transporter ATP-binding protein n=1 Tax=Dactylosporangium aurantiacum TaxID=35754 RepID=A0A9Q9ITK8_9ACTN|nr:ABC transporter ATP-binding protein [Dactylosporangium aurantiacum]MDG6110326.1 ABC transporter ATP-binding protein [Dactylosporangium aurantiacum]UWZ59675.1 ABC transporter ATP-binding protein [Dactylosporangium aurantiacum]